VPTFVECSVSHETLLNECLVLIQAVLDSWDLRCLIDLRDHIQGYLDCEIRITCENCDDPSLQGFTVRGSDASTICGRFLDSSTRERIAAVVFHEMVHAAGGTELDAEALENHFFVGNGATAPTDSDFPKFRSDEGEFVEWDETTGELFELCLDQNYNVSRGARLDPRFME
jgi:hypothetical protein